MIMMTRAEEDGSDAQVVRYEEAATLCYFESITNTVLQQGHCAGFIRHKWS